MENAYDPSGNELPPEYRFDPENPNRPTGTLRVIPGGPELMRKKIAEGAQRKAEAEAEAQRKQASARQVPEIVIASHLCNSTAVRELISGGADVHAAAPVAEGGWQALHAACFAAKKAPGSAVIECLELLKRAGADMNARLPNGASPLHVACELHSKEVAEWLLAAGTIADGTTPDGGTPLHVSCQVGAPECARALLEAKAAVDKPRAGGATPLHIACASSQAQCIAVLLQFGASLNAGLDSSRLTPLQVACQGNRALCTKALIDARADLDRRNAKGSTALDEACASDANLCAQLLLEAGGTVEFPEDEADADRLTPLYTAARIGADECVKACLKAGADVDRVNGELGTALFAATCAGSPSTVRLLLRARADPSGQPNGRAASTPLFGACHLKVHAAMEASKTVGLLECAKALIEAGAPVNGANRTDRQTPLHAAARLGSIPLVRLLLEANADPATRSSDGATPLSLAKEQLATGRQEDGRHREVAHLIQSSLAPLLMAEVSIHGLVGRPELNGQLGKVVLFDEKSGRYGVKLPSDEAVRLLPKNLTRHDASPAVDVS